MSISEQIKEIDLQISELKRKREVLAKQGSFNDQLQAWCDSDDLEHESRALDEREYPNLHAFFSDFWEEGETYHIWDYFEETVDDIMDNKKDGIPDSYILALKEAIKGNLGSFTCK
jgi:hypothetical protein